MKILIIEDEDMIRMAIEFKLKKEGYDIFLASDGKEGMSKFEQLNPDLVITDIMMPFANGLEVVNFIRGTKKSDIPIIVLSSIGQEESVMKAFELGADDYITKPFSPNELGIRIKKIISKK